MAALNDKAKDILKSRLGLDDEGLMRFLNSDVKVSWKSPEELQELQKTNIGNLGHIPSDEMAKAKNGDLSSFEGIIPSTVLTEEHALYNATQAAVQIHNTSHPTTPIQQPQIIAISYDLESQNGRDYAYSPHSDALLFSPHAQARYSNDEQVAAILHELGHVKINKEIGLFTFSVNTDSENLQKTEKILNDFYDDLDVPPSHREKDIENAKNKQPFAESSPAHNAKDFLIEHFNTMGEQYAYWYDLAHKRAEQYDKIFGHTIEKECDMLARNSGYGEALLSGFTTYHESHGRDIDDIPRYSFSPTKHGTIWERAKEIGCKIEKIDTEEASANIDYTSVCPDLAPDTPTKTPPQR